MNEWRVIITDSERLTGVAPVCAHEVSELSDRIGYGCCPGPPIECWREYAAVAVARALTYADAEECS